jgi:hypothetical protein
MEVATAGLILGGIGAATSAVGALTQGASAAAEARYRAQVSANNAIVAQQNAAYASKAGEAKIEAQGYKNRAQAGAIKTQQAASGIDVNTGSAVDVQQSQREINQLNTMNIGQEAALNVYGYRMNATNFEAEKGLEETAAKSARIGSVLGAGGSLLSNASSLGFKWRDMQQSANPGPGTGGLY